MKRLGFVVILMLAVMSLLPATASAATTTSYQFHLEVPNISADSHGDRVASIFGSDFRLHVEKGMDHHTHLELFSAAITDHTGLDLQRRRSLDGGRPRQNSTKGRTCLR